MKEAIVLALVKFASAYSGLPMPADGSLPIVQEEGIVLFSAETCGPEVNPIECDVLGYFDPDEGTIVHVSISYPVLHPESDATEEMIVVHEVTHWLQKKNNYHESTSCKDSYAREEQAYMVTNAYNRVVRGKITNWTVPFICVRSPFSIGSP